MSQKIFQKFNALQQLSALGVDTPTSFVITRDNHSEIFRSLNPRSKADYWVVRAPREQKHLIKRPAYASADLNSVFASVFSVQPDLKLLITELIPAIRSGIFVKGRDFIYCEYVPGALQSLARDGVTPTRVLLKLDGDISFIEPNAPEFCYSWSGADLKTLPPPNLEPTNSIEDLIENLFTLSRSCPQLSIIEWVQASSQQLYAVDFKQSEVGFLCEHEDIYHGLVNHSLISLPKACDKATASIETSSKGEVMFIERPLYSYVIDGSAFSAVSIVLRRGGLLAHLILECSRRLIPCIISPFLFTEKLEDREEENRTPSFTLRPEASD